MKINQKRLKQLEKMPIEKLIDDLSKIEHEQWMEWALALICREELSPERKKRWHDYIVTKWEKLEEDVKNDDRKFAKKVLKEIGLVSK